MVQGRPSTAGGRLLPAWCLPGIAGDDDASMLLPMWSTTALAGCCSADALPGAAAAGAGTARAVTGAGPALAALAVFTVADAVPLHALAGLSRSTGLCGGVRDLCRMLLRAGCVSAASDCSWRCAGTAPDCVRDTSRRGGAMRHARALGDAIHRGVQLAARQAGWLLCRPDRLRGMSGLNEHQSGSRGSGESGKWLHDHP